MKEDDKSGRELAGGEMVKVSATPLGLVLFWIKRVCFRVGEQHSRVKALNDIAQAKHQDSETEGSADENSNPIIASKMT